MKSKFKKYINICIIMGCNKIMVDKKEWLCQGHSERYNVLGHV